MAENINMETGEITDSVNVMTEAAIEAATEAAPNPDIASTNVGVNLMTAFIDELKIISDPSNSARSLWNSLKEAEIDEIVGRLSTRIQYEVRMGYSAILGGGVPSATAQLDKIIFTDKGIEGKLVIPRYTEHRHELADFAGCQVVIVMAQDLDGYFEGMRDVVVPPDQIPLDMDEATDGVNPGDQNAVK